MRVLLGVVAVVALVVAVVEGDSIMTRSKKYKLCTARDINMFINRLCSGQIPGYLPSRPRSAAPGILTIRVPPRNVRGPVASPAEIGSSYEFPSYRESLDSQRYFPSDPDLMNGVPYLLPVPYWESQDRNSYKDSSAEPELLSEFYGNALNPRSKKWWYGPLSAAGADTEMILSRQKKTTFGDIRHRCCIEGCLVSELRGLCA